MKKIIAITTAMVILGIAMFAINHSDITDRRDYASFVQSHVRSDVFTVTLEGSNEREIVVSSQAFTGHSSIDETVMMFVLYNMKPMGFTKVTVTNGVWSNTVTIKN